MTDSFLEDYFVFHRKPLDPQNGKYQAITDGYQQTINATTRLVYFAFITLVGTFWAFSMEWVVNKIA